MTMTSSEQWASVPSWELDQLGQLSSQGQLSGVDPHILAAVDQAESSGQGGGINSAGYGGFFGLSDSATYPGGWATSPGLLQSTSPSAFDAQAQAAAAEFASLLAGNANNPYAAETAYQGGSSEGTSVFANLGIPTESSAGSPATATLTGWNWNPADGFGVPGMIAGAAAGSVWSSVEPFLAKGMLVVLGLGVIAMGLWSLGKRSESGALDSGDMKNLAQLAPLAAG